MKTADPVRFYTQDGFVWEQVQGRHLRLTPTEQTFDVWVDARAAKTYKSLDKQLVIGYEDAGLSVNGQRLEPVAPPCWHSSKEWQGTVTALDAGTIALIGRAAAYLSDDKARPLFNNVYLEREYVVGSDTHFLYMSAHGRKDIAQTFFFPKGLIPFLRPGELHKVVEETPARHRYRLQAEDRMAEWDDPGLEFPDFRRLICDRDFSLEVKPDSASLKKAERLTKLAELTDDPHPGFPLSDLFPDTNGEHFEGKYLRIILKTLAGKPFTLKYSGKGAVFFESGGETITLTELRKR